MAHLELRVPTDSVLARRLPGLLRTVLGLARGAASSGLVGVILIQTNEIIKVALDVFDLLISHNVVGVTRFVAPLIRLVTLLLITKLITVKEL